MPRRASLSDWYAKAGSEASDAPAEDSDPDREGKCNSSMGGSPTKRCFSPTTRKNNPMFFIGDDSDSSRPTSPRKRATTSPSKSAAGTLDGPQEASINTAMMSILRGICADYFENNVSPILRYVQQTQEQLIAQLAEVSAKVEKKADAKDVTSFEEIEKVASRAVSSREDQSRVSVHVRLEEIAKSLNEKANTSHVPTMAQLGLKASSKDQSELEVRVRTAEKKVASLSEELRALKKMDTSGASADVADITKVKAVFAAAGLRVERQMKEMSKQMKQLQEQCQSNAVGHHNQQQPECLQYGRKLDGGSAPSVHSLDSDGNDSLLSLGASATPSLSASLTPEDRAEMQKIKTIIHAAGQHFARDLKEMKKQVREVQAELGAQRKSDKTLLTSSP